MKEKAAREIGSLLTEWEARDHTYLAFSLEGFLGRYSCFLKNALSFELFVLEPTPTLSLGKLIEVLL